MIRKILIQFNKEKVSYCILRNYEFLIKKAKRPADIDILILEKDLNKIDKIMTSNRFIKHSPRYVKGHVIYSKYLNDEFLEFDFQVGSIAWNDIPYLDGEEVLKRRKKVSYFYIPSDEDTFIMLLLHSLVGKRRFKPEYKRILNQLRKKRLDKRYIKEKISDKKVLELVYLGKFEKLEKLSNSLIRRAILRKPLTFLGVLFKWLAWKIPRGKVISIIGMDGSGKSTAIKNLHEKLNHHQIVNKIVYTGRGKNNIIPIAKIGDKYKKIEKNSEFKCRNKTGLAKSIIYTLSTPLYTLDLWLRYILQILPSKLKGEIVLTDRYSSDILLIDNVPMAIKKALFALFPKPDLLLYLYNDVQTLHKRRGHSIEDLKRQEKLFREVNRKLDSVKIKTKSEKDTIDKISDVVLNKWISKTL